VAKDKLYNYGIGDVQTFQNKFLSDIQASLGEETGD
jgi:hypothetical protein